MLGTIAAVFVACFVIERAVPGWKLPHVRTWPVRVLAINGAQLAVVLLAGVTWEKWLVGHSLFDLSALPAATGGLAAYFIATFVFYWWHRWRHEPDWLWVHFHQIHHSARRLEVITSFYKHPVEMVANSIIGSLLVYVVLGLSLEAGAVYTLCCALGEFFYHTNCRTPLDRLRIPAPGDASHPSRAPRAPLQLRRHRMVGHAVRDVAQSRDLGGTLRVRRSARGAPGRQAALPRRSRRQPSMMDAPGIVATSVVARPTGDARLSRLTLCRSISC